VIETDVLVIGSGIAGLRAAIQSRKYVEDILIIDKTLLGRQTLSSIAGGTIGSVTGYWSLTHWRSVDELTAWHILSGAWANAGIRDQKLEYTVAKELLLRQDELAEYGVENPRAQKAYGPPGRVGWANIGPLVDYVKRKDIKTREKTMITNLIKEGDSIVGAIGFHMETGEFTAFKAKATVLATGGAGEVYERNNTPIRSTGDGYVMAYNVGVTLAMMEFVDFDAWICAEPELPNFWIPPSYARTLGELRDKDGKPFLQNYVPTKMNAVRDELENLEWGRELVEKYQGVVPIPATLNPDDPFHKRYGAPVIDLVNVIARAMVLEVEAGRGDSDVPSVYLDFTRVPEEAWLAEPKGVAALHLLRDFDWKHKYVRMYPGALGFFGGCKINEKCETSLERLYAAGEVTYDVENLRHSNVFGVIAGDSAGEYAQTADMPSFDIEKGEELTQKWHKILEREPSEEGDPQKVKKLIKSVMWKYAGVVCTRERLEKALMELDRIQKENISKLFAKYPRDLREAIEALNMAIVGEMVARSALLREETRGNFTRKDYPYRDDKNWIKNTLIRLEDGKMKLETEPIKQIFIRLKPQRVETRGMEQIRGDA